MFQRLYKFLYELKVVRYEFCRLVGIFIVLSFCLNGCSLFGPTDTIVEKHIFGVMDTDVEIKAYGSEAESAVLLAADEISRLDSLLNAYADDSEISMINKMAGESPVEVSDDTLAVIDRSLFFAEISEGIFEPTILPLIKLWSVSEEQKQLPDQAEIEKALSLVDYTQVEIDVDRSTVFLPKKGMGIDLGAIAKGYAVDKMAEIFYASEVDSFLINAGGNVYLGGKKPDKSLWRVGVTDPRKPEEIIGVVSAEHLAVVSSGDYRRYFVLDGTIFHHIIDPITGYPSQACRGTTVLLPSSTDADALSTILFILGPDESQKLISEFDEIGAIYVKQDGNIVTQGLLEQFELK